MEAQNNKTLAFNAFKDPCPSLTKKKVERVLKLSMHLFLKQKGVTQNLHGDVIYLGIGGDDEM